MWSQPNSPSCARLAEALWPMRRARPNCCSMGPSPRDLAWRDWPAPDQAWTPPKRWNSPVRSMPSRRCLGPHVALGAGAFMTIEPTRALVAVDVNTGPDTSPAAGLKANIAAVRDLPRQLAGCAAWAGRW
jgi:ribonuclease G